MGLFVPILRFAMLFLNVWETYKTLQMPPPSKKNDGLPSVRALSQRKRDMKGCIAVWMVWCIYIMYERSVDTTLRIFTPFYDEIKSVLIIFLMLSRARGAEPIYLHVIRPVLKPHTGTIDMLLDFFIVLGDFLFAILMVPVHLVIPQATATLSLIESRLPKRVRSYLSGFADNKPITPENEQAADESKSGHSTSFASKYGGPPTPPPEQPAHLSADAPRGVTHASQLGPRHDAAATPFVPPPLDDDSAVQEGFRQSPQ